MVAESSLALVIKLSREIFANIEFGEAIALKDAFGPILTVVILLEFNRSILAAMRAGSGIVELRIVVEIVIIVIARKLILFEYETGDLQRPLFLSGLILSLGALYWLIGHAEQVRRRGGAPAE
jgi:uncharacterized membrane protein (DUF373 family)